MCVCVVLVVVHSLYTANQATKQAGKQAGGAGNMVMIHCGGGGCI